MRYKKLSLMCLLVLIVAIPAFRAHTSDLTAAALLIKALQDKQLAQKPPIQFLEEIRQIDETMDNLCDLSAEKRELSNYSNSWVLYLPYSVAKLFMSSDVKKKTIELVKNLKNLDLQIAVLYHLTPVEEINRKLVPELSDRNDKFQRKVRSFKKMLLNRRRRLVSFYKDVGYDVGTWEGISYKWIEDGIEYYFPSPANNPAIGSENNEMDSSAETKSKP